jgi:hypothetical protein
VKKNNLFASLLTLSLVLCGLLFTAPPATAADDYNLQVTKINPAVDATNYTTAWDLGSTTTGQTWRTAYVKGAIPALTLLTNSATTATYTLQTSTNNSTWTLTSPVVQGQITGATSATNTATTLRMPIPPTVSRYVRVQQILPALAGDITSKTNVWTLYVP